MTTTFTGRATWCRFGPGLATPAWSSPEDEASLAQLELQVGSEVLTRAEDALTGAVRDHAVLPAARLAEWFVWNWWRLRWEPRSQRQPTHAWLAAHDLATLGAGWLWPQVEFSCDGVSMQIRSRPSVKAASQPLRYLCDATLNLHPATFEEGVSRFVELVDGRLRQVGMGAASLSVMWQELQGERADPELSLYRRFEATLGHDPDAGSADVIEQLLHDARLLGVEAVSELAANGEQALQSAAELNDQALRVGRCSRRAERVALAAFAGAAEGQPAWRAGVLAAHQLRRQEALGTDMLGDDRLAELFAVPRELLATTEAGSLAYELATQGTGSRVVLRAKWPTGRRFELARLLGDYLLSDENDHLHPATPQYTFRQKRQRAFAAELLCPIEGLQAVLGDDYSEDAQQGAAEVFKVSPMIVARQLVNNGLLQGDQLFEAEAV